MHSPRLSVDATRCYHPFLAHSLTASLSRHVMHTLVGRVSSLYLSLSYHAVLTSLTVSFFASCSSLHIIFTATYFILLSRIHLPSPICVCLPPCFSPSFPPTDPFVILCLNACFTHCHPRRHLHSLSAFLTVTLTLTSTSLSPFLPS